MKKRVFKKAVIHIHTMGLTVYCETKAGQYRLECEGISKFDYDSYIDWAKKGDKWGYQKIGKADENGVTFAASLPKITDMQGIVSFCAGLAFATIAFVCPNAINGSLLSRVAGVIYNCLMEDATEEIEEKEEKK